MSVTARSAVQTSRPRSLLVFVGLAGLALANACVVSEQMTDEGGRICTPQSYVYCNCRDGSRGTKRCRDDARTFDECTTGQDGVCEEVIGPDTNHPLGPNPPPPPVKPTNPLESCPGQPTAVAATGMLALSGDTRGATDNFRGRTGACAAGGGGGDHVYRLQPTATGRLSVKVQGEADLNPTVYLRTTCSDEATQVACAETTPAGGLEQLRHNVVPTKEYFLVVDGASGSAGKYTLTLELTAGGFCGDGAIDIDEACDDGNKVELDGCSNDCRRLEGDPMTANGCPGQPVDVWPGRQVSGLGSTTAYGNLWTKTGTGCAVSPYDVNANAEHVYAVTPHGSGSLSVTLTPTLGADLMLVARTTCADPTTQGAGMCAQGALEGGTENMTIPVENGQPVYVAVEGAGNVTAQNRGAYTISFSLP